MTALRLPEKVITPKIEKLRTEINESPCRASAYKQMARVLIGMEQEKLAARVLRAGLTEVPDDQGLLENLARAQQAGGFLRAAASTWRRVTNLFPESFLAYEKLERHYVRSGSPRKAVNMYHRIEEDDPLQEKSLERIVFVCKEAMDVMGTVRALKKLIKKYGVNYKRSRDLGRFHFKADHYKEASRWLEKAFSLGEGDNDLRLNLALAYARQKKYRLAEKHINHILADRPNSYAALINLCEFTIEEGNIERAESILARIEKLYSNNSRANLARGEIYLLQEDFSSAEKALRSGIRGTAYFYRWELERGYRLLGDTLEAQGNAEEADFCRLLAGSLSGAPDAYQAFINLAEEKLEEQEVMLAGEVFKELARMFPNNARIVTGEAEVEIFKGYPLKAIDMLNRVIEKTPEKFIQDKIKGYRVLSHAYKNLGDWEGARNSIHQAELIESSLS
jgi:predicted Zn-dependent protease